jgi:hypothetical protein
VRPGAQGLAGLGQATLDDWDRLGLYREPLNIRDCELAGQEIAVRGRRSIRRLLLAAESRDGGARLVEKGGIDRLLVDLAVRLIGGEHLGQHPAHDGIRLHLPEGAHLLGLRRAVSLVFLAVDIDAEATEERGISGVGIIQHVAAAHTEQLFKVARFDFHETAHARAFALLFCAGTTAAVIFV